MKTAIYFAALFLIATTGCERTSEENQADFSKKLRSSKTELQIGERTLIIEAYLWRDFMPVAPVDGHPLRSVAKLRTKDESPLPVGIELIKQYVIKDNEVWSADIEETRVNAPHEMEGMSINGPKWGPDIVVDVVLEFKYDGQPYFLMVVNQQIEKTH